MSNTTVREFIHNYENGKYVDPSKETMIKAGWHDWFCEDEELKIRLDLLYYKVKRIALTPKINIDKMYVFFKNNCPGESEIYDDFRFCDMESGNVIYTVVPASGHRRDKGQAELWGRENNFKEALVKGTWDDILAFFGNVEKITLEEALAKRDEARRLRTEYGWGFWDAVVAIMKNCGFKELDAKAVQL